MKLNLYLVKSAMVGALGGLLFGFDTAVIAGATHGIAASFSLSPAQLGLTVSMALWGTVLGATTAGMLGERMGGRGALRIMALLYLLSSLGCAFAWSWYSLLAFRFLGGIGIGGSSVLGPVYIAEIAPAKWRGRLVGMFQVNVVLGILLAYFSNFGLALVVANPALWHWQLGIPAVPALLFLLFLYGIPNSSRWLVTQNRLDQALEALRMIGSDNADAELQQIVASIHVDRANRHERVFQRKYLTPILLAISIGMFNQLSGINALLYYLNDIFFAAGFSRVSSDLQAVWIGAANLAATLLGMLLVDYLGRKALLLIGSVGTAICLFGVARLFLHHAHSENLLWLVMGFIVFFAISQGAVIWIYISEVFPNRVRSKGQSIGSSAHWIMNATIAGVFPVMAAHSGAYPFFFFAAMMALQFIVVLFFYPETRGASLEAIQARLGIE